MAANAPSTARAQSGEAHSGELCRAAFSAVSPQLNLRENICVGSKCQSTAWLPSLSCHTFLQAGIAPRWESTYSP